MPSPRSATASQSTRKPKTPKAKKVDGKPRLRKSSDIRVEGDVVERRPKKDKAKSKDKAKGKDKAKKKKKDKAKKKAKQAAPGPFTAKTADRHELYQLSVQSPDEDVSFFARVYRSLRKKPALHLREDFCGTALLAATWAKRGKKYSAEGFDIDPDPVGWGIEHNFTPLGKAAERVKLHLKDVREPSDRPPDVRVATNFSYWIFKQRAELLGYFRAACQDLAEGGVFVIDTYGGPDALNEVEEEREIEEGFTYVWDQDVFWPATGDYKAYIHFRFEDGTELKRAFRYDWRIWFLTELRDVLLDAGFTRVESYWEGTDEDGESGNGIYKKSRRGENCDAWVTYLVASK